MFKFDKPKCWSHNVNDKQLSSEQSLVKLVVECPRSHYIYLRPVFDPDYGTAIEVYQFPLMEFQIPGTEEFPEAHLKMTVDAIALSSRSLPSFHGVN